MYIDEMDDWVKRGIHKVRKVNTALFLYVLCIIVFSWLLYRGDNIGLSQFSKDLLVVGLVLIVVIVAVLAYFRSESLLYTSEQKMVMERLRLGDSGAEQDYEFGQLRPVERPTRIEDQRDEDD